jgi:hypothetical protein
VGTRKNLLWNSSLAPQSSARRYLSSTRPLPTIDEITESEWRKEVQALKKASSQSPLPPKPGSPNSKFSSTSPAVEVTDNDTDNSDESSHSYYASTNTLTYTGGASMPVTSKLHIVTPQEDIPRGIWPVFRLMVRKLHRDVMCTTHLSPHRERTGGKPNCLVCFCIVFLLFVLCFDVHIFYVRVP